MQEVWTTAELRAHGWTARRLTEAVRDGSIVRLRRDRYCAPSVHPNVAEAVRVGGRLGCISLLHLLGVWVSTVGGVHVHAGPHGRCATNGRHVVHWVVAVMPGSSSRVSPLDALLAAMLCQTLVDAVATVDSALRLGLVTRSQLVPWCHDERRARILSLVDPRAESGLESIVRVALVLAGLRVEIQVVIRGVGRVDLLVEGCVIVETDGRAHHAGARRHRDHVRDATATSAEYSALRFDPQQVLGDLSAVVDAVVAAVASHRAGLGRRSGNAARRRAERTVTRLIS